MKQVLRFFIVYRTVRSVMNAAATMDAVSGFKNYCKTAGKNW
jgi:hypothetical protein